jgi:hypothetical protein
MNIWYRSEIVFHLPHISLFVFFFFSFHFLLFMQTPVFAYTHKLSFHRMMILIRIFLFLLKHRKKCRWFYMNQETRKKIKVDKCGGKNKTSKCISWHFVLLTGWISVIERQVDTSFRFFRSILGSKYSHYLCLNSRTVEL